MFIGGAYLGTAVVEIPPTASGTANFNSLAVVLLAQTVQNSLYSAHSYLPLSFFVVLIISHNSGFVNGFFESFLIFFGQDLEQLFGKVISSLLNQHADNDGTTVLVSPSAYSLFTNIHSSYLTFVSLDYIHSITQVLPFVNRFWEIFLQILENFFLRILLL